MGEVATKLARLDLPCIDAESRPYFSDVLDHVRRVQGMVDGLREVLTSVFEFSTLLEQQRTGIITRQLAAWAGLTPRHHSSGTSGKTQTPITKIGSVHLRRGLFMPAMTARVYNPLLKEFGDRLQANGKTPKQVIIAIMRKLLHQIYGILKSGMPYNPNKRGFQNALAIAPSTPSKMPLPPALKACKS